MSIAVHEAVKIDREGELNSKSEWRLNTKNKLKMELRQWENDKMEAEDKKEKREQQERINDVVKRAKNIGRC